MKKKNCLLLVFFVVSTALMAQNALPENGKIYRIVNPYYDGIVLAEDFSVNTLFCTTKGNENSYTQLWKLVRVATTGAWRLQNIFTGRYVVPQPYYYNRYTTSTTPNSIYISSNVMGNRTYNILNLSGGSLGMHCDASRNIVPWTLGTGTITASEWRFEEVTMTDDQVAAAQVTYQEYLAVLENKDNVANQYIDFFTDEACTKLKPEYASMSDSELSTAMAGYSAQLIHIATKVKNDVWTEYEKEFRIANYGPYSNLAYWSSKLKTNNHCPLSNPTGIYGNSGDVIYVFVGTDIPQGATLEIDRVNGNAAFGQRETLKKGMNIIPVGRDMSMLFIAYHVDTSGEQVIADYDSLKIHIQGGVLNGYWDKSRHTDTDWVKIARGLATHEMIQVKGDRVLFHMDRVSITAENCCYTTVSDAIGLWDNIVKWEHEVCGVDKYFPVKFNNHAGARTRPDVFMSAEEYFTNYQHQILTSILPSRNVQDIWGPAHEFGHMYQHPINMIGCTEVSNNVFSNAVLYNLGIHMSRGETIAARVAEYEAKKPFLSQGIWQTTRMFWQLYLYYHVAGNNPNFYPTLFDLLRKDPLQKIDKSLNYASNDQLKFAEKCAEAAGEDLTKFFEAVGLFVPMESVKVDDFTYTHYYVTSTQEMINSTKAKLAAYPKKAGAIEFIEDRVAYSRRGDGVNGNRWTYDVAVGEAGDVGQYTAYTPDSMKTTASGYLFETLGKVVRFFNGKGAVGFRVYDKKGNLLTFCNTLQHTLNDEIFAQELIFKAVSANGEESEILPAFEGDEEVQKRALTAQLEQVVKIKALSDATGTKVGFFYSYELDELMSLSTAASTALSTLDQTTHTYGEWAKQLSDEITRIYNDEFAKIGVDQRNYYTLRNARYNNYRIAFASSSGGLGCSSASLTNDFMRFTFIPQEGSDKYLMRHMSGNYISKVERSTRVEAKTTNVTDAIQFNLISNLEAQFCVKKVGEETGNLHCDASYAVVGWSNESPASYWYIVCVNDNKTASELRTLDSLMTVANKELDKIIDKEKSSVSVTLLDYVEVIDSEIYDHITSLKSELTEADSIKKANLLGKYTKANETLMKKIAVLRASYTIPTTIEEVELNNSKPKEIYTLSGKKVERIGNDRIYIIDGKKVLIKK